MAGGTRPLRCALNRETGTFLDEVKIVCHCMHASLGRAKKSVVRAQTAMSRRRREPSSTPAKVRVRLAAVDSAVHTRSSFLSLFLWPDVSLAARYLSRCSISVSLLPSHLSSSALLAARSPLCLSIRPSPILCPVLALSRPLRVAYSLWRARMVSTYSVRRSNALSARTDSARVYKRPLRDTTPH